MRAFACGFLIKLAHRQHAIDTVPEVFLFELEHVHGEFAGEDLAAGIGDHLKELLHGRDIQLLHFLLHETSGKGANAGDRAHPSGERQRHRHAKHGHGHVQSGVSHSGNLHVIHGGFGESIEAEEGEEQRGLYTFHAGSIGHDERGIDAIERTAADDDADFFDGLFDFVVHDRGIAGFGLDAADGLGDAGDLGGLLQRAAGKEIIEFLRGDDAALAHAADGQ